MLRVLGAGSNTELERTLNKFSEQKERLKKQLIDFINYKNQYPFNGSIPGKVPGYGDSDKKFRSGGNFDTRLPSISHAHLTHNLSIVYYVDKETNTIRLYGIYSHDDIGTGSPPNRNRQEQVATKFANMKFDASEPPEILEPASKEKTIKAKASTVDYTPKQTIAKPQEIDRTMEIAKQVDQLYPQRNIAKKIDQAQSLQDMITIINNEALYLQGLRQRHTLYKNQQEYVSGLETLYRYIVSKSAKSQVK